MTLKLKNIGETSLIVNETELIHSDTREVSKDQIITIDHGEFFIGTGNQAHLQVKCESVCEIHCRIFFEGKWYIEHLGDDSYTIVTRMITGVVATILKKGNKPCELVKGEGINVGSCLLSVL